MTRRNIAEELNLHIFSARKESRLKRAIVYVSPLCKYYSWNSKPAAL